MVDNTMKAYGLRRVIKRVLFYIVLTAITAIFMLPFWIILTTSLRNRVEAFSDAVVLFFKPTFVHYIRALAEEDFLQYAFNSFIIASSTTLLVSYLGALTAFTLTRFVFKGYRMVTLSIITARMFPPIALLPAFFLLASNLRIVDTRTVVIFAHTAYGLPFIVFMMLGFFFFIRFSQRPALHLALLSGVMWGYGILVRPFPGTLFVPVVALGFLFFSAKLTTRQKLKPLIVGAIPVIVVLLSLLAVNAAQTGDPYASGYHAAHQKTATVGKTGLGLFKHDPGIIGNSVGGALLRQNFWLFGWPISLIFIPFAKPRRHAFVFFGLIAAVYAYRFILPKTVVSTLGPVYVTEIVPLLSLATARGIVSATEWITLKHGPERRHLPAAIAVASVVVAFTCFLPIELRDVSRGARIRTAVLTSMEKTIPDEAVVFTRFLIDPKLESTWAPHPPNPSPDLGDRIIFVRSQSGKEGHEKNVEFWKRRFPNRSAWRLRFTDKGPLLSPLIEHNPPP